MNTLTLNELTGVTTSLAMFRNNQDELQASMSHIPASDPIHAKFSHFNALMQKLDDNLEVQIQPELLELVQEANTTWQQIDNRLTDH
ncbi:hypothetical protein HC725_06410 [Vibrio sp. S17_S38]|uniref:hypothetical protein n=1 Tax=Vibrio sp. S17_S38 TaxID=2720229 RepID=UPI00168134A2|nr:hypothetical protein [Vibrio sp. S17_S38]MBD1572912.1 hypothetical protein [Vibrio sp. S17_S38]